MFSVNGQILNILGLGVLEAKLRVSGGHLYNRAEDKFHEFFINEIQNIIIEVFFFFCHTFQLIRMEFQISFFFIWAAFA